MNLPTSTSGRMKGSWVCFRAVNGRPEQLNGEKGGKKGNLEEEEQNKLITKQLFIDQSLRKINLVTRIFISYNLT